MDILKEGKVVLDLVPEFKKSVENCTTRAEYEAMRDSTIWAAGVMSKYIIDLYKEVNEMLDHRFSIAKTLDEIDKAQEARDILLSLHYSCHDVIELEDTLHYLAYKEALKRRELIGL